MTSQNRTDRVLWLTLVFLTFFLTSVHWYTQFVSYPIAALVGNAEASTYGSRYEAGLVYAIYIPYTVLMLTNLVLLARGSSLAPRTALVAALLLNLCTILVSLFIAVPVHNAVSALRASAPDDAALRAPLETRLLWINALRLGSAVLSSAIVLFWSARALTFKRTLATG
jgi:hypothetical protein